MHIAGKQRPGWNAAYSAALITARTNFPNDPIAQHRVAERVANRASVSSSSKKAGDTLRSKRIELALSKAPFGEGYGQLSIVEEFSDHIIARSTDGRSWRISYTVVHDGAVHFGDPQQLDTDG